MIREIKFRAWDKKRGKLLTVFSMAFDVNTHSVDTVWCAELMDEVADGFDINDVELMQFTGLTDKQGKEIYEGDILRMTRRKRRGRGCSEEVVTYCCEVKFFAAAFRVESLPPTPKWSMPLSIEFDDPEVIGNIYQNPDLIPHS